MTSGYYLNGKWIDGTDVDPVAERDPNGLKPSEAGAKLDEGKPRMELLQDFGLALRGVAEVATFGAKKYSDEGWLEVKDGSKRYTAAMLRHLFSEKRNKYDKESKLLTAKQVAWNALARLEFIMIEEEDANNRN